MFKIILRSVRCTFRGWMFWHRICKRHRNEKFLVVFIPYSDEPYNYCALLYLDDLLSSRMYEKAILISTDNNTLEYAKTYHCASKILENISCSEKEAYDLLKYYSLYNFDDRFVLATMRRPYGKDISRITSIPNFDYEEAFAYGVYNIAPYSDSIAKQLQR